MSSETQSKIKLILRLKKVFGEDSIVEDFTRYSKSIKRQDHHDKFTKLLEHLINLSGSFRELNLICVKNPKNDDLFWLYFHYSKIGFYGFNKITVDELFNLQTKGETDKTHSYLLLIEDIEEEKICFLLPIYFIRRIMSNISISRGESPQLKMNLEFKHDKYLLKLLKGVEEDISHFCIGVEQLFDKNIYERFNEEKEKYNQLANSRKKIKQLWIKMQK